MGNNYQAIQNSKKDKSERTVELWAKDFIGFVKRFGAIRKKDIQDNIRGILESSFDDLESEAFASAFKLNIEIPSDNYEKLLIAIVREKIKGMSKAPKPMTSARAASVLSGYERELLECVASALPRANNKALTDAFVDFGAKTLISGHFSPLQTGIAIAGFGDNETFPSMVSFETDGYVGAQVKISPLDVTNVSREMHGALSAFAQHDIAFRFMEGIDPFYSSYLHGLIQTTAVESALKVFERWAPNSKKTAKARAAIRRAAIKQAERLDETAKAYRRRWFWRPTVGMVALLPKDELAHLAESLVELTALHRKVSTELETVGGCIDVAIISKSDGFVWVKRKHYFDKELNPQFGQNYMREVTK